MGGLLRFAVVRGLFAETAAASLRVGPSGGSESSRCARLRLASPAMLAPSTHRETRYAPSSLRSNSRGESVHEARPRARGRRRCASRASRYSPPEGPTRSLAGTSVVRKDSRPAVAPARPGGGRGKAWGEWRGSREAQVGGPRAAGAHRPHTRRDCSSAATKERSEFPDGPGDRASQGSGCGRGSVPADGSAPHPRDRPAGRSREAKPNAKPSV